MTPYNIGRIVVISAVILSALGLWLVAWKGIPSEKKGQRPYILVGAICVSLTAVVMLVSWH